MKLLLIPVVALGAAMFVACAAKDIQLGVAVFLLAQIAYITIRVALAITRALSTHAKRSPSVNRSVSPRVYHVR